MNAKLKQKFETMLFGYAFLILNLLATSTGYGIIGLWFGIVAMGFFIKALSIRNDKSSEN